MVWERLRCGRLSAPHREPRGQLLFTQFDVQEPTEEQQRQQQEEEEEEEEM